MALHTLHLWAHKLWRQGRIRDHTIQKEKRNYGTYHHTLSNQKLAKVVVGLRYPPPSKSSRRPFEFWAQLVVSSSRVADSGTAPRSILPRGTVFQQFWPCTHRKWLHWYLCWFFHCAFWHVWICWFHCSATCHCKLMMGVRLTSRVEGIIERRCCR